MAGGGGGVKVIHGSHGEQNEGLVACPCNYININFNDNGGRLYPATTFTKSASLRNEEFFSNFNPQTPSAFPAQKIVLLY